MRMLGPVLLTLLAAAAVGVLFMDWGVTVETTGVEHPWDGWRYGLYVGPVFGDWAGDWKLPHALVLVAIGLATVAGWLRAAGLRVPRRVPVGLAAYAVCHTAANAWYFVSGRAAELSSSGQSSRVALGGYLAVALSVAALVAAGISPRLAGAGAAEPGVAPDRRPASS